MKKSTELDVDFIGGQGPLTKSEEQTINEFMKSQKILKAKKQIRRPTPLNNITVFSKIGSYFIFLMLLSCSKSNETLKFSIPKNIAVSGNDNTAGAEYWNDNHMISLTGSKGFVQSVAFSGSDIYATGFIESNAAPIAVSWKNGIATSLSDQPSFGKAILVSGSDVYIVGTIQSSPYPGGTKFPVYWKNNVITQLESLPGYASGIAISGSDVYVSGGIERNYSSGSTIACYWKNGILHKLVSLSSDSTLFSLSTGIAISGTDVYVSGIVETSPPGSGSFSALYWKNGQATPLLLGVVTTTTSISVSGSDVYVAGYDYVLGAGYWKNCNFVQLSGSSGSEANQITISGSDVYVAGAISVNGLPTTGVYWKNGLQNILTTSGISTGISVQ